MKILSAVLNVIILCSMVFIGISYWNEAKAEEKLRPISDSDRVCLAQNIFFEARNQAITGQVAVAWVTLNRYESDRYPNSICGVVHQANKDKQGKIVKHKCQFSWYCDGKSDRIPNNVVAQRAWEDAQLIAKVVLLDWARGKASPVKQATMYHATYVKPYWRKSFTQVAQIEDHIFYQ